MSVVKEAEQIVRKEFHEGVTLVPDHIWVHKDEELPAQHVEHNEHGCTYFHCPECTKYSESKSNKEWTACPKCGWDGDIEWYCVRIGSWNYLTRRDGRTIMVYGYHRDVEVEETIPEIVAKIKEVLYEGKTDYLSALR